MLNDVALSGTILSSSILTEGKESHITCAMGDQPPVDRSHNSALQRLTSYNR